MSDETYAICPRPRENFVKEKAPYSYRCPECEALVVAVVCVPAVCFWLLARRAPVGPSERSALDSLDLPVAASVRPGSWDGRCER